MSLKFNDNKNIIIACIVFALFAVMLYVKGAGFEANFISYICLFIIAGQGWNLLGGYIGEISFGHAVFFGIGAYCVGLPIGYGHNIPLFLLVILGGIVSAGFAYIISFPLLKITGFPFLIGTFGLGIVFERVFVSTPILFATKGIFIPPVNRYLLYSTIVATTLLVILATQKLVEGDLGLKFKAVRDSFVAAEMIGINIFKAKMLAFVIGAFYVGIAGALYALYSSFVHPLTCFPFTTSMAILLGSYIGGVGTVLGPAVGAVIVILVQEFSRAFIPVNGGHHLVLGLILLFIMLLAKEGLYPTIINSIRKIRSRQQVKDKA